MKKAERAGRFFCTVLAAAGAVFLLLPVWGIRADVVLSGSMEPALRTGSIVFTDTENTAPEPGDIITYRLGNACVTHRVVDKDGDYFITKGDANDGEDASPVKQTQIEGIVLFSVPLLGYAAVFFQKKTVFCLLLLMLAQEIIFLIIQRKGERREQCAGKPYE